MTIAQFRNDSVSTIYLEDYGHQRIVVSEVVTMTDEAQKTKFGESIQLDTLLSAGDLVYIDDLGVDRSYADAARILDDTPDLLKGGGDAGEILSTDVAGDLVWTKIEGGTVIFFDDGAGSANLWLKVTEGQAGTSNLEPVIMPFDSIIYAITFVNKDDSIGGDIELYKNGSLLFTWNIVNKRWAYKTDGLSAVTFSAGDRLSIYLRSIGEDPNDPMVTIHYSFLNSVTGSGGAETGV